MKFCMSLLFFVTMYTAVHAAKLNITEEQPPYTATTESYTQAYVDGGGQSDIDDDSAFESGTVQETSFAFSTASIPVADASATGVGTFNKSGTATKKTVTTGNFLQGISDVGNSPDALATSFSSSEPHAFTIYDIQGHNNNPVWLKGTLTLKATYTSNAGNGNPDMDSSLKADWGPNTFTAVYSKSQNKWAIVGSHFDQNGNKKWVFVTQNGHNLNYTLQYNTKLPAGIGFFSASTTSDSLLETVASNSVSVGVQVQNDVLDTEATVSIEAHDQP